MDSKSLDLHEASFSSYLTKQEDNFVLKLTDQSVQFTHPAIITSSQEISLPARSERTKAEEGEISVFGAERYFNMKLDDDGPRIVDNINAGKHVHEKEYPVDRQRMRPRSRLGTPSVSSEASWNSQKALLPNPLRNSSPTRHQKVNERWFFSGFACINGSCSDKKSVYTDKNIGHRGITHGKELRRESARNPIGPEGTRKQSQSRLIQVKDEFHSPSFKRTSVGSKRREYFVLPCVNSGVQNLNLKGGDQKKIIEDDPRISLEVFGSHLLKKEDIALNLERKLSVLTWDAIPKSPNLPPTSASSCQMYEDIESDGSSDLFEIENLSGSSHLQPIFTKQTSDGMSSCMMTPTSRYYEPSEGSIEWSVVTASAADFSAVSVEYDEKMVAVGNSIINPGLASTVPGRSRSNGLLGCNSQKAVDVAEAAHKRNDRAKSHSQQLRRTDAPIPVLRNLQAHENMVKDPDFP
uniref:Uncharacterized protein n=1 Tax=Populus davidiana TaxID=266767 RepID=A0A6M2ET94_9ROSI